MYPINLESQYEKYFKSIFKMYCDRILTPLLPVIKNGLADVKNDSARGDAASDIFSFVESLRHKYGDFISEKRLGAEIAQNFNLIDEWSRAKTTAAIQKMYSRLNTPQLQNITGRKTPEGLPGELWGSPINLKKTVTDSFINKTVASNVALIKTAGKEYFDDISDIVKKGIAKGESYDSIRDTLMDRTGAHASRAQFWARDQVGKFFGDVTRMRQENAGIPGYVWRTMEDGGVRDSHRFLEGTFHRWNSPPAIPRPTKGGGYILVKLHPGEDFNCRCFAEPALGPEAADREYRPGAENFNTPDTVVKTEFNPANWGGEGIMQRVIIDTNNTGVKSDVESALGAVNRLLKISTGNARALTVTDILRTDPMFSEAMHGYHYYSGHIAINPDSAFKQSTTIHEFFHWIDRKVLPRNVRGSFEKVIAGIKKTDNYKMLQKASRRRKISKEEKAHFEYLMQPSELFARAMEQYMAQSGIDSGLKNEFGLKKNSFFSLYWVDSDFGNVYFLIDDMFKGLGWK